MSLVHGSKQNKRRRGLKEGVFGHKTWSQSLLFGVGWAYRRDYFVVHRSSRCRKDSSVRGEDKGGGRGSRAPSRCLRCRRPP